MRAFDADIYDAAVEIGAAVEERIRSEAAGFTESGRYHTIRRSLVRYAEDLVRLT